MNSQFRPLTRLVHGGSYISFSELKRRSPGAAEHGDADFYVFRSDLIVHYALSDRTEVFWNIPYKALALRAGNEDEHHRDETLAGIGDIRLGVKHFFYQDEAIQIAGLSGVSFPAGKLNKATAASYLNHDEAEKLGITVPEHSHLQLGTGTFDPFWGMEALFRCGQHWMLFGTINADTPLYANRYDYRTSASGTVNLGPPVRMPGVRLIVSLLGDAFFSGRDRLEGEDISGPRGTFGGRIWIPNTGRFEMAIKPGVTWGMTKNLTLNLQARIPVHTRIREDSELRDVQLAEPGGIFVGISYNF